MKASLIKFFYVLSAVFLYSLMATSTAFAATIVVDTPGHPSVPVLPALPGDCDTAVLNDCSFEEAITKANKDAGADDIVFNMLGFFPSWSLNISAPIAITEALTIDGYTQPWTSTPNTVPAPGLSDAILNVMIDGSGLKPGENCFDINTLAAGDPVLIKGLAIGNCPNHGMNITGSNITIQGSYIGTRLNGTVAAPNGGDGIYVDLAHDIFIGGANPADRNVISGNVGNGIMFSDSVNGSDIEGNFIGLDKTGLVGLGNGGHGVSMGDRKSPVSISGNNVGNGPSDLGDGKRNYISGNALAGVYASGTWTTKAFGWVQVDNNYIGTDVNGTVAIPNIFGGVIGEITDDFKIQNNLISGNKGHGVWMFADTPNLLHSNRNGIFSNKIGTDSTGLNALGNGGAGVYFGDGMNRNYIGDSSIVGSGNIIAFNRGKGVIIYEDIAKFTVDDNKIETNSIFGNTGLGIDLDNDGVTLNDANDADTGANSLQNYPIVESALYAGGNTTITGSLHSVPLRDNYRIEVFSNNTADPTGYGEGETYLGSTTIAALDAFGDGTFSVVVAGDYSGKFITATATDKSLYTSEFGPMLDGDLSVTKTSTGATKQGDNVTFTITVSNSAGPNNASSVQVKDLLSGFTFASSTASQGTYTSSTGIWDVGTLTFGSSATLTISAQVSSCGNLSNTASITRSGQFDGNTANNTSTVNLAGITCTPVAGGRPTGGGSGAPLPGSAALTDEVGGEVIADKYCTDYTFSPKEAGKITRYEFAKLMLDFNCYETPQSMPEGEKSFTDYPRGGVYEDPEVKAALIAMYFAADEGILGGYPDGTLRPFEPVVYAEASKILYNSINGNSLNYAPVFTLLPKNLNGIEWFFKYFIFLIDLVDDDYLNPSDVVSDMDAKRMVDFVLEKYPK
ncbi:hypothetical protein C0416_04810 [bacterium]|nr:hypothetical protein [bacterium]